MFDSARTVAIESVVALGILLVVSGCQTEVLHPGTPSGLRVERLAGNPIIRPEMLPDRLGENINGPSLIRVPEWIEGALGRYYLYFAHHHGSFIRLAYADDLAGPWTIHEPGSLHVDHTACNELEGTRFDQNMHIGSPEVQVDDESRQIRMYFHCPVFVEGTDPPNDRRRQRTFVATSTDGLSFRSYPERLGRGYFRVFRWAGFYYSISYGGMFYRSNDGLSGFSPGTEVLNANTRHFAVIVRNDRLLVFYTLRGDNPERIVVSDIDLSSDWTTWSIKDPLVVLEPEFDWEGGNLPAVASAGGIVREPVRQLRDPAIFEDAGRTYLLYSTAGESGIGIAEIYLN